MCSLFAEQSANNVISVGFVWDLPELCRLDLIVLGFYDMTSELPIDKTQQKRANSWYADIEMIFKSTNIFRPDLVYR